MFWLAVRRNTNIIRKVWFSIISPKKSQSKQWRYTFWHACVAKQHIFNDSDQSSVATKNLQKFSHHLIYHSKYKTGQQQHSGIAGKG